MEQLNLNGDHGDNKDKEAFLPPTEEEIRLEMYRKKREETQKKAMAVYERKRKLTDIGWISGLLVLTAGSIYHMYQQSTEKYDLHFREIVESSSNNTESRQKAYAYLERLKNSFGEAVLLNRLKKTEKIESGTETTIAGFEELGFGSELIRPILNPELYPENFSENVEEIVYTDKQEGRNKGYFIIGGTADINNGKTRITLYRPFSKLFREGDDNPESLHTLIHEMAHLFDWDSRHNLTITQRLEFLEDLLNTFLEQKYPMKNYRINYDGILNQKETTDSKVKLMNSITEWWAELCAEFLTNPDKFEKEASDKEKKFLEKWLLSGKEFDTKSIAKKRFNTLLAVQKKAVSAIKSK